MKNFHFLFLFLFFHPSLTFTQIPFAKQCEGTWEGTMYIYAHGAIKDSVPVRLSVAVEKPGTWTWKTEYLSAKMPMTKDYKLILKDAATGKYATDEGDGTVLTDFQFGNKLYSVFETADVMLTSSYELIGNQLIFEVSSGKKEPAASTEVDTFSVDFLQRVIFRRTQ